MPSTRYGLSARLTMKTRYGLTTSAAPVMSSRKRYGLTTENRQIVSTLYPFKTERYSIRYAREVADTVRATRREREFEAVLVASDPLIRRWEEHEVELITLEPVARSYASEVELLESDEGTRNIMQPVEENPLEAVQLLERTFEVRLNTVEEGVRALENEVILSEGINGIRNVTERVDEANLIDSERIIRTYASFLDDLMHQAIRKPKEIDALLIEIEGAASPFKMVYEHQLETASVKMREYETEEAKTYTTERANTTTDVIEHTSEIMTHLHAPFDVIQSESYASTFKTDTTVDVDIQPLEPARRLERVFDSVDSELPHLARRDQEEVVSMASTVTAERDIIQDVMHAPSEAVDLVERIREIAPLGSIEVAEKNVMHAVEFNADVSAIRQSHDRIIELAASEQVSKRETIALIDFIPLDMAKRLERELDVYLEELGAGNSKAYLVYESVLEPAARRRATLDIQMTEDTQAGKNAARMHAVEFSTLETFDKTDQATDIEFSALEGAIRNVISETVQDQDEAVKPVREAREAVESEVTSIDPGQTFETVESTFDASTKIKVIESELVESVESDRIQPETVVRLEQFERSIRNQVEPVTIEPVVFATRVKGINVILQAFDLSIRSKETDVTLEEGDTMERQAKEAILTESDEAKRSASIDVVEIKEEHATRTPLVDVEESVFTYATRTMTYIDLIEGDEAVRTIKPVSFIDNELGIRKKIVDAFLEELEEVDEISKTKKRIWLIQARANHWNALSHWKKTR